MTEPVYRTMPHALGMEKSVLSSLMRQPGLMAEFPLDPEIFWIPAHRVIYGRMKQLPVVELVALIESLQTATVLEGVGGPAAVTDILTYAPNSQHFERHLQELRERHARREAIKLCKDVEDAAYDQDGGDFLGALSGPVSRVFDIVAAATPPEDIKEQSKQFLAEWQAKVSGEYSPMGPSTGLVEVDVRLRGVHEQQMGVISARSGGGKSTMATQMASSLAVDGVGVLYLILERTTQSTFQRCVIQTAGIHHEAVSDPLSFAQRLGYKMPDRGTLKAIKDSITKLVAANLHIRKPPNRRLATQCAEIRRYVRLHGVKVVFLDQIGLVKGDRQRGDSEEVEKRGVSNTLQELAHELHITIIVLSQVTDDIETKGARAIEEDADWWLHIAQERDKKKDNFGEHLHVLIAKDSHHGHGGAKLPLVLDHQTLRFIRGVPKSAGEEKKPGGRSSFGKSH
jgi:replicative DNA helicase